MQHLSIYSIRFITSRMGMNTEQFAPLLTKRFLISWHRSPYTYIRIAWWRHRLVVWHSRSRVCDFRWLPTQLFCHSHREHQETTPRGRASCGMRLTLPGARHIDSPGTSDRVPSRATHCLRISRCPSAQPQPQLLFLLLLLLLLPTRGIAVRVENSQHNCDSWLT